MYPSPRFKPPLDAMGVPVASPKKKVRPNVTRHMFALPAIHQFEPVLASPRSARNTTTQAPPNDGGDEGGRVQPSDLSGSQSVGGPKGGDHTQSPRFRPQPPPPISATASRTDQDLFRYNQGAKQRMSIRPLFEQRREEEAEVARRILTSREIDRVTSSHEGLHDQLSTVSREHDEHQCDEPQQPRQMTHSASRRATTPVTASELADLRSDTGSGSGSGTGRSSRKKRDETNSPRERDGYSHTSSGPATGRSEVGSRTTCDEEQERSDTQLVRVRFRTPTPPSSAGPSRSHIIMEETVAAADAGNTNGAEDFEESKASARDSAYHPPEFNATADGPLDPVVDPVMTDETIGRSHASVLDSSSLVAPLKKSTFYEPYLEKRGAKLSWLRNSLSPSQVTSQSPTGSSSSTAGQPAGTVCYKLLWKDTKRFSEGMMTSDDEGTGAVHNVFMLRVVLGSNGKCHIEIQMEDATTEKQTLRTLPISVSDLLSSTKARPDLPIMTPRWAQWLLSRVERDTRRTWFVRIQDMVAMGDACVFEENVKIAFSGASADATADHTISVAIYVLGNTDSGESLLVHARDRSAALAPLTEIILMPHELETLATSLGRLPPPPDPEGRLSSATDRQTTHLLLRDKAFLRREIAEGKTLRLALKSGLHTAQDTDSVADLPFRMGTGSRSTTAPTTNGEDTASVGISSKENLVSSHTIEEYEAQGLSYASPEIQQILRQSEPLASVAFISQAYCEDAIVASLRWLQRKQAVDAYVLNYANSGDASALSDGVRIRIEAAKRAKLEEIAVLAIIEDLIGDFIAVECRLELHHAKFSGGYDDYYASKVQATFRMSYQKRGYESKRHVRLRAARLIQALQRGIMARRRYCEMRVEREKYLFYGFRSSLHQTTAAIEDPRQRAKELAHETERRRQTFLMQVLHGYAANHGIPMPFFISSTLVQSIFNEYGVVVGCAATLGDSVAAILMNQTRHGEQQRADPAVPAAIASRVPMPQLFGSKEIHAALLTALRLQYDDTYGLTSGIRRLDSAQKLPAKVQQMVAADAARRRGSNSSSSTNVLDDTTTPARWLLKVSIPFQRANRNRLAAVRLSQKVAGQQAAHLVALDHRNLLMEGFQDFDKCRAIWEASIRDRREEMTRFDAFTVDQLVQYALDRLTLAVKDWGLDAEPLFEALNLCLLHRLGKQAISLAEQAFTRFADGVNAMHGKRSVFPLRDEIDQELEQFEALVALRCLNIANDCVVTVPPSELLHVLLVGKVDEEYLRHVLPSVLPIASIREKVQLASKIIRAYANAAYGDAFNSICWSCLDTAENVTVEAAQFLERITRPEEEEGEDGETKATTTIAARVLYLLTGSQALQFLQFFAKVAHFNKPLQRRVLQHLEPYAKELELHRLASVVCSLASFEIVSRLFDQRFSAASVHVSTRFWVQYGALYGDENAERARASCKKENASAIIQPETVVEKEVLVLPDSDANTTTTSTAAVAAVDTGSTFVAMPDPVPV